MANPTLINTITPSNDDPNANCRPLVYVFRNANADNKYRKWAAEASQNFLDQLMADNRIGGYRIKVYDSDWFFLCDTSQNKSLLKQFDNYRDNNGFDNKGTYIAIHNCDPSQYSSGNTVGAAESGDGWSDPDGMDAHATQVSPGGGKRNEKPFKTTVMHEHLHNLLVPAQDQDTKRLAGCVAEDHNLGTVNSNNKETPMSYKQTHRTSGCCSGSNPNGTTKTISECTSKGVQYTAEWALQTSCVGSVSDNCTKC